MKGADLDVSRFVLLSDWSPLAVAGVAVLCLAVVALAWLNVRPLPPRRRYALVGLRALAVLGLFALFLEPGLRLENITRVRNHLVILLDASRSMELPGEGGETRMEAVQRYLGRQAGALDALRAEHVIDFYGVSDHARPAGNPGEIAPTGDATRLAVGLSDVASRYRPEELAGVLVFSDGADNGALGALGSPGAAPAAAEPAPGAPGSTPAAAPPSANTDAGDEALPAAVQEAVLRLRAPITTFFTGPDEPVPDVAITDVHYDEFAFVHNAVSIEADIAVQGYGTLELPVTLRREDVLLGTRVVQIDAGARGADGIARGHLRFEFVPDKTGKATFTLEVARADGERVLSNNRRQFVVRIIRDKIRVLQVVGRPSWDERFMRQLLKKNPNVDLISFFILRTNSNMTIAPPNELSLIPFPTEELFKEQLGSFDLIIFQNFTYRGYRMEEYLPLIRNFVHGGGGFVMTGGDLSFASGGYAGTPIEEFLPVVLPQDRGELLSPARFRPALTEAGKRHPITQLSVVPEENAAAWAALPTLSGMNRVMGLKPGAVALLTNPDAHDAPVAVAYEFGEGRVLNVTTDSTWHWDLHASDEGDNRHYYKFWGNAIRWLIKDPALQPVRVQVDRDRYPLGAEATATVRVAGRDYLPAADTEVTLELERFEFPVEGGTRSEIVARQTGKTNEQGEWVSRFKPPADGAYRVRARAIVGGAEASDDDPFVVAADPLELRETRARPDTLRALAEASGGEARRLSGDLTSTRRTPPQVSRVNRRQDVPLWSSAFWLLLAILVPSAEWYLRRRWGLL